MTEIVNLRLARKARQRSEAAAAAEENRARFGRTRGEKAQQAAEAERLARTVDGARREPGEPGAE